MGCTVRVDACKYRGHPDFADLRGDWCSGSTCSRVSQPLLTRYTRALGARRCAQTDPVSSRLLSYAPGEADSACKQGCHSSDGRLHKLSEQATRAGLSSGQGRTAADTRSRRSLAGIRNEAGGVRGAAAARRPARPRFDGRRRFDRSTRSSRTDRGQGWDTASRTDQRGRVVHRIGLLPPTR